MEKINVAFSGQTVSMDSLFPDPKNTRKHGEKSIKALMKSLEDYGQLKPIVALATGRIITGNGLFEAARRLGWAKIAVVLFQDADEAKAKGFSVVDNRTAELSSFNEDALSELSKEIDLKALAGVDEKFLKKYVQEAGEPAPKEKKQLQCPHCNEWFDAPKRGRKAKVEKQS
jgi:ParB-like chromosome segregation protein Spo0J